MLPTNANIIIRDGMESDIAACLALDHSYETDRVWQMQSHHEEYRDEWQITLKMERLPRMIEVTHTPDERHLRLGLPDAHCFIVAVNRDDNRVYGYLTMTHDAVRQIGQIEDMIVTRPARRHEIGSRLIKVARLWAKERQIARMNIHMQTKNVPAIQFCQHTGFQFCGFNDRFYPNQDIAVFFSHAIR